MTEKPTRDHLLHLVDRARRGVALPEELDQLATGITAMAESMAEQRTATVEVLDASQVTLRRHRRRIEKVEADRDRVQQAACRTAETLRHAEERLVKAEAAIARVENLRTIAPDGAQGPTWAALDLAIRAALDQPQQPNRGEHELCMDRACPVITPHVHERTEPEQQPTEDEARQLPCSLWLLSNGHVPHRWQPQPGMADVHCPGAPRKAAATQQQPTTSDALDALQDEVSYLQQLSAEQGQALTRACSAREEQRARAERAEADLARVQQAACRTAETLRHAEDRIVKAKATIAHVEAIATRWEKYGSTDLRTAARILRAEVLDQPQQPTTTGVYARDPDCETGDVRTCTTACPVHGDPTEQEPTIPALPCSARVPNPEGHAPLRTCDLTAGHAGWHHDAQHQDHWVHNSPNSWQSSTTTA